jgi:peptidoglycan/LPS O-acetylase OafA/YrhL
MSRLAMALIAYLVLGVLSWTTISDPRIRLASLAILALFAVKTWVRRKEVMHPDEGSDSSRPM